MGYVTQTVKLKQYTCWSLCLIATLAGSLAQAGVVEKCADAFDQLTWQKNQWSTASLNVSKTDPCPESKLGDSSGALAFDVSFSGKGFEHMLIEPADGLQVPGKLKRISFYAKIKRDSRNYGFTVGFVDGWGMNKDDRNRKLEYSLGSKINEQWQLFSFDIPSDWVQPIRITGFGTHNYSARNESGKTTLYVDQLVVETDTTDVDPNTGKLKSWTPGPAMKDGKPAPQPVTPLLSTNLSTTQQHNIFAGRQPTLQLSARSWLEGTRTGTFSWTITDAAGNRVATDSKNVTVESQLALSQTLSLPRFGLYTTEAQMKWDGGAIVKESMQLAYLPQPVKLTQQQKEDSPYGMNVHGGRSRMIQTFRDAGMVWFRDYAFNYKWMVRAKGADKTYSGWPWFPPMVKEYNDAGAMLLACHPDAIADFNEFNTENADDIKPDLNWTREMVDLLLAFPSIKYHELDNEYDLPSQGNAKFEVGKGWPNYQNYHKKFGEIVNLIGDGKLVAVENGRAGTWPQRLINDIESGSFKNIDVVNTHHYCGVDPPEINVNNNNTDGVTQTIAKLYFDQLRDIEKISGMDGKPRPHWVTEFGWDTKAGHIVSHLEQAAYLQRSYMMFMAAGVDKAFWFFDLDSKDANNFFDGCGLVDHEQKPKLAICSFAALAHLLPTPKYVGMLDAGPGTWGYVFEDGGQLTAAMWTIKDVKGPTVQFKGAKLYDYLANPIAGDSTELGLTAVYAKGISRQSNWFAQTAYHLASPMLESVTSGDSITADLAINNLRDDAIQGQIDVELPKGWQTRVKKVPFSCQKGEKTSIQIPVTLAADAPDGESLVKLHITESGKPIKTVSLRVRVQKRLSILATSLVGQPGESSTHVKLVNASASQSVGGKLHVNIPGSWQTPSKVIAINAIAPRQTLEMDIPVTWSPQWATNESASLRFVAANGEEVAMNLSPGQMTMHAGKDIKIDGQLGDWDAAHQLPAWTLGSTKPQSDARLYMAWTPEGLLLAGEVEDSVVRNTDPKSFWHCDVFELFIDTNANATKRKFVKGDHQFWFVPRPEENRMYIGQWKRGDELSATQFDIAGIQSACRRSGNGYTFEMLLPAKHIAGYTAKQGKKMGVNLNLSVQSELGPREIYWPQSKKHGDISNPAGWGVMILGQ
ncbi:MAG TPA: hypothetical protein DCM28_22955 [Phycisphaerales bacterium]|nr:hypothetical protein [Phycisphaerales bacterium]HCD33341.1 hypothetical protein [Phycisphaerales bacterium]|tara:strand:- start:18503 stop:21943 length:3441 start_codon:yes stop_codon:yes gene_type:complete